MKSLICLVCLVIAMTFTEGVTKAAAEGGCGPYAHRDWRGYCVPNEWRADGPRYAPPRYSACPAGWYFAEGRCWRY
jgi:hypothetical protein